MDILTLLIVGLCSGVLAALLVGGSGYGIIGDIVVGIAGAFIGSYVFRWAGWHSPVEGLGGTIFVATIGALILLVILHVIQRSYVRRREFR